MSKTLGQVGYETMLTTVDPSTGSWLIDAKWEDQPPTLRAHWELVATAIEIAVKEQVIKEVAAQMGGKL